MPDIAAALKQYGFVGQLANSNPELRKLLVQAANEKWDVNEFSRAVQDSRWWKATSDARKQYDILRVTKPAEFRAQNQNLANKVRTLAAEMGVRTFGGDFAHFVNYAQMSGWDEATLRQKIGGYLGGPGSKDIQSGKAFGGQAGQVQQQIRALYYDMGVPYNGYTINQNVQHILQGGTTIEAVQAQVMASAKSRFPSLAAQIDAGQTVRQIADPYIQTQAQLLEIVPGKISLQDPLVKKGLSQRDAKGQLGMMPLWQYEQEVRKDARWDQTKNARDQYATMAHQIGRDWGFTS